jgi:thiosulfate reductase cytochrome b subunit
MSGETNQMEKKWDRYLIRFNRLLVWVTLVLLIAFVIFGYGILNPKVVGELTGGLLTRGVSLQLHIALAFPLLILLLIHILIGARTALTRWGVKQGELLDAFLILLGVFVVTLLAVMQYLV